MEKIQFLFIGAFVLGLILGILGTLIFIFRTKNVSAILGVNTSNPEKDKYNFVVLCPLDDIPKKKYMIVKVMNGTRN